MIALKLFEKITPSELDSAVISHVSVDSHLLLAINCRFIMQICKYKPSKLFYINFRTFFNV